MVINLKEELEQFALEIKESNPDYTAIYMYLTDYINNVAYKEDIELQDFLINEFSKRDIIKACAYYFENSNATKVTAIDKFLNSITKFYVSYMKPRGYDNTNLFSIQPFARLKNEVADFISDKEMLDKEVFPPITDSDFEFICIYLNEYQKPSIVQRQISIIFKLIMLYGLKLERIKCIEKSDFDTSKRLLTLRIEEEKSIILELPHSLTLEIESYLEYRGCSNCKYMFFNTNNEMITPSFLADHFKRIKKHIKDNEKNRFTSSGLAKYGILKMLEAGVNVPVIKLITGMEDDIINDCTRKVYGLNKPNHINRYINSKIRSVQSYDEIGIPEYIKLN